MNKIANYCKNCGATLSEKVTKCPDCGIKLSKKSKVNVTLLKLIFGIFFLIVGQGLDIFVGTYMLNENVLTSGYSERWLTQLYELLTIVGLLGVIDGITVKITKCNTGKSIKTKAIIILICALLSAICAYVMNRYMGLVDSISEIVVYVGIIMYCIGIAQGIIAGAREINTKEGEKNI